MAFPRNRQCKNPNRRPMSVEIQFDILRENEKVLEILDEKLKERKDTYGSVNMLDKIKKWFIYFKRK